MAQGGVAPRGTTAIALDVRFFLSILAVLLVVPGYDTIPPVPRLPDHGRVRITPVTLDLHDPARRHIGAVTFLGGVALSSSAPAFGGFSSIAADGDRLTLLSDGGTIVRLTVDPALKVRSVSFANLPDGPGTGWRKEDRDSESMTVDPATGSIWVGFERWNAIWRYAPGFAHAERRARPDTMAKWPPNGGPESMVRLADGHFVVIAETGHWPHQHDRAGLWFDGDPTEHASPAFRFAYRPPAGYDPSDVAELPDGDLIVVNRRFALPYDFTAILTIVPRQAIRAGAIVGGKPIATLAAPLLHDNFEGIAVARDGADTILWLVSDDNQSWLQRSLLLKFRLDRANTEKAPRPR